MIHQGSRRVGGPIPAPDKSGVPRVPRVPRFHVDALETRRLFAPHIVNGTDGPDTITVSHVRARDNILVNEWHVVVNGTDNVFRDIAVQVRGLDGADTITVNNTQDQSFLEVFGGSGDDTITVGGGNVKAKIFALHVEGDGGNDTVVVDDRDSFNITDYRVGVGLPGPGIDMYFDDSNRISLGDDVQVLRLLCRTDGGSDIHIRDAASMQLDRFEVRGGPLSEHLDYAREGSSTIVDFDGGGSQIDDTFDYSDRFFVSGNRTINLEANRLVTEGAERAVWRNITRLNLEVDGAADAVNVTDVAAGMDVSVDAGRQRDTFTIGGDDIDANIRGGLSIRDVQDGITNTPNAYVFQDTSGTTGDVYRFDSQSFTKSRLAKAINFFNASDVTLNANAGDNTITALATTGGPHVTVNAGAGADTIQYGGEHLADQDTTLTGQGGTDTIVFNDDGLVKIGITDKDYTFANGVFRYFENGTFKSAHAYDAEAVVVNSGSYDSTFAVVSTGGETTMTLNGGGGADRLPFVPSTTVTSFAFNGEGGSDAIDIDDTGDTIADTYTFTKTAFDKTGFSLLTFGTSETLLLRAHSAVNTFDVNGVAPGTALTIVAGNSPDLFRVGAGDLDSNISGTLELVGEQGGDRVIFDDTADTGNDGYRLDNGVLTKANVPAQTMQYRFVETVELNGSAGDNVFTLVSPGFALDVTLRGFNGADSFDVTPSDRARILIDASDPTVPPGDALRLSNAAGAGPATLTPNGPVNGTYNFASAQPVTFLGIETFPAPAAAPSSPDLLAAHDSGISNTDNVTRIGLVTLTGSAPAGSRVLLRDGDAEFVAVDADTEGVYSFLVAPGEGVHTYTAVVVTQTSQLRGNPSAPLVVTVDFTPPDAPPAPDLAAASDTGASITDDVTRDNTPTFEGRAATGTTVILLDGNSVAATVVAAGSAYSVTSPLVADGLRSFRVALQDPAGNSSPVGPALPVTIDTAPPRVVDALFTNAAPARLSFTFDEDVPSLAAPSVTVINRDTGQAVAEAFFTYSPNTAVITFAISGRVLPAGNYRATISKKNADAAGNDLPADHLFDFIAFSSVSGRRVFFNNSAADGNDPAANAADDAAIAPGKTALLPGGAAGPANVTSYSKGLNGVMVDLLGLPAGASPSPADFELHAGDGSRFDPVPAPAVASRPAGGSGVTRVTLTLPDGKAKDTWLRVTVKATPNTGLASPDVFYFGNLPGNAGFDRGAPTVNATDLARTRAAVGRTDPASLEAFDFNRDGRVDGPDVLVVRNNQRHSLPLLTAPAAAAPGNVTLASPRVLLKPVRRTALGDAPASLLL
jgi:hypothetical protein